MKTNYSDVVVEKDSVELVVFAHDDQEDPHNWSKGRKVGIVAILCWLGFCAYVVAVRSTFTFLRGSYFSKVSLGPRLMFVSETQL